MPVLDVCASETFPTERSDGPRSSLALPDILRISTALPDGEPRSWTTRVLSFVVGDNVRAGSGGLKVDFDDSLRRSNIERLFFSFGSISSAWTEAMGVSIFAIPPRSLATA